MKKDSKLLDIEHFILITLSKLKHVNQIKLTPKQNIKQTKPFWYNK